MRSASAGQEQESQHPILLSRETLDLFEAFHGFLSLLTADPLNHSLRRPKSALVAIPAAHPFTDTEPDIQHPPMPAVENRNLGYPGDAAGRSGLGLDVGNRAERQGVKLCHKLASRPGGPRFLCLFSGISHLSERLFLAKN